MTLRTAAAALALILGIGGAAAQQKLTISVYGISQDSYRKHLYAPFEAQCGCKLVVEVGNSSERLAKLEARKDNPEVDMAVLTDFNALEAAQKGLIDKIDVSKLSNYDKLYDFARDPIGSNYAVGYTFYSTGIIYRTDKVKISSWKDLWKPELKNRLALPNITTSQGPTLLFMVDRSLGGTTPDFAAAINHIGASRKDVVNFYERSAQLTQLFQQDEIWAAVTGRFNWPLVRKLNMPIAWASLSDGESGGMNVMALVKGSKNKELALKFMDYWLSAEVQSKIAADLVDSPANRDAKVSPEAAESLTYGADMAKAIKFLPPQTVIDNRVAWLNGWNEKIAR
ncbi:ABC transporter substrate-binding protein [Terrarubrum flagellatum]|uniref:ABC transporter substrate-binding protein n=1 Tax=Terrirubrum flagellatum TaxID=2895980 RepID=UPI0031452431